MAKIEKRHPLPSHTKLKYDECHAKILLEKFFPEVYNDLQISDRPDLRDVVNSVGVEVTSAIPQGEQEALAIACTIPYLSKKERERKITYLKAKGYEVGTSLVDDEKVAYCKDMMDKAAAAGKQLLLPIDTTIAKSFPDPIDAEIEVAVVDADKIPADQMGLDIGTKTQQLFADAVKSAKTVVWNGPMGVFENPTLAKGTIAVAKALAETDATTIIGGGDSAAAVMQLGFADKMSHISTGGGASLEYLVGKVLPGVAAIADK